MFYTDSPFDRADQIRKDQAQVDALWHTHSSLILPAADGKFWVVREGADNATIKVVNIATSAHQGDASHSIFLGMRAGHAWFTVDYTGLSDIKSLGLPANAELMDLRSVGPILEREEGAMLAYAQALHNWHRQSHYCQVCGHANELRNAGHVRVCTQAGCGRETFPRTDSAVIMLITHEFDDGTERCLLGRNPAWNPGIYSTLAGFVEPGETLENAVRREVFEEAGIEVGAVNYVASQPWPFPQSIMLGFQGKALSTAITLDPIELAAADWFSKNELAEFGNWGDDNYKLQLPRPDSIARHLINSWMLA